MRNSHRHSRLNTNSLPSTLFKQTVCLQHLILKDSDLSDKSCIVIYRSLRKGSHLISLNLENSNIQGRSFPGLGGCLDLFETIVSPSFQSIKIIAKFNAQLSYSFIAQREPDHKRTLSWQQFSNRYGRKEYQALAAEQFHT